MAEGVRDLARRRATADVLATLVGVAGIGLYALQGERLALLVGVYGLLLGTSTAVVTFSLTRFTGLPLDPSERDGGEASPSDSRGVAGRAWGIFTGEALESDADVREDTGWLIGRLENLLVLTLVLAGQYTALSIIFAAKSWVRREDTSGGDTTYYLAGTLVNFTYSIVVGLAVLRLPALV